MKTGDVLNDALAGYRAFWRYLGPLALVAGLAVVALVVVLVAALGDVGLVAGVILAVVANFWIVGLLVQTADDLADDEYDDPWIGTRLERFWPHVNTLSVAALLLSLVLVPGYALVATGHPILGLLFLAAGVVVLTWCVLTVPLIVIEGYDLGGALRRSKELVSGNAWKVFGTLFVAGFLTGLLSTAVESLAGVILSEVPALAVSTVFDTVVITPFLALVLASIYYTLSDLEATEAAPTPA